MNNGLLLIELRQEQVDRVMDEALKGGTLPPVRIHLEACTVECGTLQASFTLSPRYRRMFLQGLDLVGESLAVLPEIEAFAHSHWRRHPWMRDVGAQVRARLQGRNDSPAQSHHV